MAIRIRGGSPGQRARLRRILRRRAPGMLRDITDPRLRDCIRRHLYRSGTIEIHQECEDPFLLGWNRWRIVWGHKLWAQHTVHLCWDAHFDDEGLDGILLAETVIHELAHSCCWDHGGGQGVPE